jgi:hypothetical protein
MTESFAQLFEQSIANQRIRPGMILTGLVVNVGDDMVIVNVGLKSEAVIPLELFLSDRLPGQSGQEPGSRKHRARKARNQKGSISCKGRSLRSAPPW